MQLLLKQQHHHQPRPPPSESLEEEGLGSPEAEASSGSRATPLAEVMGEVEEDGLSSMADTHPEAIMAEAHQLVSCQARRSRVGAGVCALVHMPHAYAEQIQLTHAEHFPASMLCSSTLHVDNELSGASP